MHENHCTSLMGIFPNWPIMLPAHRIFVTIRVKLDQRRTMDVAPALEFAERLTRGIRVYRNISPKTLRVSAQDLSNFLVSARAVVVARARGRNRQHLDVQQVHYLEHFFRSELARGEIRVDAQMGVAVEDRNRRFHDVSLARRRRSVPPAIRSLASSEMRAVARTASAAPGV